MIAAIEGPVALIEVGCSAGLCLYPDRYAISYDGRPPLVPGSPVTIDVATTGPVPVPGACRCRGSHRSRPQPHRSCFAATSRTPSMPRSRSSPTGPHRSCSTRRSCTTSVRRAGVVAARLDRHDGLVWVSNEAPGVVDGLTTNLQPPATATRAAYFVIGRGRRAVGIADTHGSGSAGLDYGETSPILHSSGGRWSWILLP